MSVVMEGDIVAVIMVNAFGGYDGSAKIAPNISDDIRGFASVVFGINVKTVNMISVDIGFDSLERRSDFRLQFIEQGGTKGISQISVIKMCYPAPNRKTAGSAFGEKTVNVRIPFQVTTKSMENTDETGSEVFGFVHFIKQLRYNTVDSREKTV